MQLTIFEILDEINLNGINKNELTENDKKIIFEKVQKNEIDIYDLWNVQVFKNAYDFIMWLHDDETNGHVEIYTNRNNINKTIKEIEKLEVEKDERCTWLENEKVLFINY